MEFTRNLKKGSYGEDVFYIKNLLFDLGYFSSDIKEIKSYSFGNDTVEAVEAFQRKNKDENGKNLKVDGIVGRLTWNAIEKATTQKPTPTPTPLPTSKSLLSSEFKSIFIPILYSSTGVLNLTNETSLGLNSSRRGQTL